MTLCPYCDLEMKIIADHMEEIDDVDILVAFEDLKGSSEKMWEQTRFLVCTNPECSGE
jgi:hypothetical protein